MNILFVPKPMSQNQLFFFIRLRNSESSATRSNTVKFEVVPWSISAIVLCVKEPAARMFFDDDHIPLGTTWDLKIICNSGYKPARDQHHKERNTCEQECGHHCKLVNTRIRLHSCVYTMLNLSYRMSPVHWGTILLTACVPKLSNPRSLKVVRKCCQIRVFMYQHF